MDIKQAQAELRAGFEAIDDRWKRYAKIISVDGFPIAKIRAEHANKTDWIPTPDAEEIETYGKILILSQQDIESGKWRQQLRLFGSAAAKVFNRCFWVEALGRPDPDDAWRESLRLSNQELDNRMQGLEVEVHSLDGHYWPRVEECRTEANGDVVLRGYCDLGWRRKAPVA